MPRKHPRVRVERGLYRTGDVYLACATPFDSTTVVWSTLGPVGLMEVAGSATSSPQRPAAHRPSRRSVA